MDLEEHKHGRRGFSFVGFSLWFKFVNRMLGFYVLVLFILSNYGRVLADKQEVAIGVLVGQTADDATRLQALHLAINYVNNRDDILPTVHLKSLVNYTDLTQDNSLESIQHVCSLVQSGVAAIIAPVGSSVIKTTHPVCAGMHVPHISPDATDPTLSQEVSQYPYLLKMSPPDWVQSEALVDLCRNYGWSRFGVVASMDDYGQNGLTRFVTLASRFDWTISSFHYFIPNANNTRSIIQTYLQDIKNKGARVVILNCYARYARLIIDVAHRLGMYRSGWAWIVTDGVTAYDGLFRQCVNVPIYLHGLLGTSPLSGAGELYPLFQDMWDNTTAEESEKTLQVGKHVKQAAADVDCSLQDSDACTPCNEYLLGAYDMRTMDAVLAFAYALDDYLQDGNEFHVPDFRTSVCSDHATPPWQHGELLFNYLAKAQGPGIGNDIHFTAEHYISSKKYDIVNLIGTGWNTIGSWSDDPGFNKTEKLDIDPDAAVIFPGSVTSVPRDTVIDMSNVTLKIVTILEAPFVMETTEEERSFDPRRLYKGFCIDLLQMLQYSLQFNYTIHLVPDGSYGTQDPETREWNGMMAELVNRKCDMSVSPITINYERQQYVEFTKPYMDLGLTILMPKEEEKAEILGFLRPFETNLWIAVVGAFILCAVITTCLSYLSPYGHYGSYVQRINPDDTSRYRDRKALRLIDSIWYTYASWMNQGADVTPKCLSGRFVHGVWWFAVMVISATYTANLAAFLTVRRLDSGINSVGDLANQVEIPYGTVENSAVSKFFETQVADPYTKMSAFMKQMNTNVPNSSHGIELVRRSEASDKFGFIFDSAPLQYAASNKPCTTRTVGNIFNQFGYGLAFPKNSPYVETFSLEILKLRENGSIEALNSRWISSGSCLSADQESNTKGDQITIETMLGVFIFVGLGLIVAFVLVIFECCAASYKESRYHKDKDTSHVSMCGALSRRTKAVCSSCCCCCSSGRHGDHRHKNSTNAEVYGYKNNV